MARVKIDLPEVNEIDRPSEAPGAADDLVVSKPPVQITICEIVSDRWHDGNPDDRELDFEPSEQREVLYLPHDQEVKKGYKDTGCIGWNYPLTVGKSGQVNKYSQYGYFLDSLGRIFPDRANYDDLDQSSWVDDDGDARGEFVAVTKVDIQRPRPNGDYPEPGDNDYANSIVKEGVNMPVANPENLDELEELGIDEDQIEELKATWEEIKEEQGLVLKSKSKKKTGRR